MATTTLEKWVDDRQTVGRYTFLRREAIEESGLSAEAVKKALQRLTLPDLLPRRRVTST